MLLLFLEVSIEFTILNTCLVKSVEADLADSGTSKKPSIWFLSSCGISPEYFRIGSFSISTLFFKLCSCMLILIAAVTVTSYYYSNLCYSSIGKGMGLWWLWWSLCIFKLCDCSTGSSEIGPVYSCSFDTWFTAFIS